MTEQRISLTRILALNWYGFRQIIDLRDNVFISGSFGSGKSVLLDLIQYVLLGEHWRPNRAAAGNARSRTLISYCLCDSNLTRDGETHYTRRSGATIIGLEFSWPASPGVEPKRETWGIRVEYASATSDPKRTYFGVPDRLTWEMLAPGGQLRSDDDFRTFLRRDYGHDVLYPTQSTYLDEMATPRHLWFDREQLNKTLWKSIAFEPEADVERFIRDFILEESPVDVSEVRRSVASYRETQLTLELQEEEAKILGEVCEHDAHLHRALRDEKLYEYLRVALEDARLSELLQNKRNELELLDATHAREHAEYTAHAELAEKLKIELEEFRLEAGEEELRQKESEKRAVLIEQLALTEAQKTARDRLKLLARRWGDWLRRGGELGLDGLREILTVDESLLCALTGLDEQAALDAIPRLAEIFRDLREKTDGLLKPIDDQVHAAERRLREIKSAQEKLERKELPGAFPLFQAVRAAAGPEAAEQLCRVIEIKPEAEETWRAALEMLLGRTRFAILVAGGEPYRAALDALKKSGADRGSTDEAIIHPREAGEMPGESKPGSIAAFVEVKAPKPLQHIAEAYVRYLLGSVIAVEHAEQLDACDRGITPQGILKQKPLRRRLRQISGYEYTLGREGLRRLEKALLREEKEKRDERTAAAARAQCVRQWVQSGFEAELNNTRLPDRSSEFQRLPQLASKLDLLQRQIEKLETPERAVRLQQRAELETARENAVRELGRLQRAGEQYTLARRPLVDQIESAESDLAEVQTELALARGGLPASVAPEHIAEKLAQLRAQHRNWSERKEAATLAAREAAGAANTARHARDYARSSLRTLLNETGGPRFPHWRFEEHDEEENARWQNRCDLLLETELPKYRQLAGDRRREWERRLKDQVLNRLNENVLNAEATIRKLRTYLDRQVGQYRYRISQRQDPAFHMIFGLLNTGFEPTDELLAASRSEETQRALDELMIAVELGPQADARLQRLLDYRQFHRYDLEAVRAEHAGQANAPVISLGRSGSKLSGGENQAPFFISMLAAYRRVYDLGSHRSQHLGLVVMDEAFSKLSGDGVEDCLELARNFNLQLVMAFPIDRLGVMVRFADTTIVCRKEEVRDAHGYVSDVQNIPILVTPQQIEDALG